MTDGFYVDAHAPETMTTFTLPINVPNAYIFGMIIITSKTIKFILKW